MILNYASAAADYVTDELVVDLSKYINDPEIGIPGYAESKPAGVVAEEFAFEDGQQHIIITQQTGPIFFYNKITISNKVCICAMNTKTHNCI